MSYMPSEFSEVKGTGFHVLTTKSGAYILGFEGPDKPVYGDGDSYFDAPSWHEADPTRLAMILECVVVMIAAKSRLDTDLLYQALEEAESHMEELDG